MLSQRRSSKVVPVVFRVEKPLKQTQKDLREFNQLYRELTTVRRARTRPRKECSCSMNLYDATRWQSVLAVFTAVFGIFYSGAQRTRRSSVILIFSTILLITEVPLWFTWCVHPARRQCLLAHSWLSSDMLRICTHIIYFVTLVAIEMVFRDDDDYYGMSVSAIFAIVSFITIVLHLYQSIMIYILSLWHNAGNREALTFALQAAQDEELVNRYINRTISSKMARKWSNEVGQYLYSGECLTSKNPVFDNDWEKVIQPLLRKGPRAMISETEFEDDDTIMASSQKYDIPSDATRTVALRWLIKTLQTVELGDKSASGPFKADKFPLQNLELCKQVLASTHFLPVSLSSRSIRKQAMSYEPSAIFQELQKFVKGRLEVHQRYLETIWAGDTSAAVSPLALYSSKGKHVRRPKIAAKSVALSLISNDPNFANTSSRGPKSILKKSTTLTRGHNKRVFHQLPAVADDSELVDVSLSEDTETKQAEIKRVQEEKAKAKLRSELRHTFANPKCPRQDDLMWCSLLSTGDFFDRRLPPDVHNANNIRYITLLSFYGMAVKDLFDARIQPIIARNAGRVIPEPVKSFMSMWQYTVVGAVSAAANGDSFKSVDVKAPRAAACVDIVRTNCIFNDPRKLVDAYRDMLKSMALMSGIEPVVLIRNSFSKDRGSMSLDWGYRKLKIVLLFDPKQTWGDLFDTPQYQKNVQRWENIHGVSNDMTGAEDSTVLPSALRNKIKNIGIPFAMKETAKTVVRMASARFLIEVNFCLDVYHDMRRNTDFLYRIARAEREVDLLADLRRGRDVMALENAEQLRNFAIDQNVEEHVQRATSYWKNW